VFLKPPTALGEAVSLSVMHREVAYEHLLLSNFCRSLVAVLHSRDNQKCHLDGNFWFQQGIVKLQAQSIWKKNRSVQEVLFTTCAQEGTVCQIFISTGLVHTS